MYVPLQLRIAPPSLLGPSGLATASLPARIEAFQSHQKSAIVTSHHIICAQPNCEPRITAAPTLA